MAEPTKHIYLSYYLENEEILTLVTNYEMNVINEVRLIRIMRMFAFHNTVIKME